MTNLIVGYCLPIFNRKKFTSKTADIMSACSLDLYAEATLKARLNEDSNSVNTKHKPDLQSNTPLLLI